MPNSTSRTSLASAKSSAATTAGAFGATRLIANHLFGVKPMDPITIAAVAVVLAVIALLACYIPARRATKLDPLSVLRAE